MIVSGGRLRLPADQRRAASVVECQYCGEELPLNGSVCTACGKEVEQYFLTEEVRGSRVSKLTREIPVVRRLPSPRRQVGFTGRGKTAAIIIGLVAVIAIAVFAAMALSGGESKPENAEEVVDRYYEALEKSDFAKMKSYFANAFQPTREEPAEIEKTVGETKYHVIGPDVRTVSEDKREVIVEIESLQVKYTKPNGGTGRHTLSTDVLQPLHLKQPNLRMLVRVMNEGSGWLIADRPMNGWSAENLWLIGNPGPL